MIKIRVAFIVETHDFPDLYSCTSTCWVIMLLILRIHIMLLACSLFAVLVSVNSFIPSNAPRVAFVNISNILPPVMSQRSSKLIHFPSSYSSLLDKRTSVDEMDACAQEMKANAESNNPFTENETESALMSIKNLLPKKSIQKKFDEEKFIALVKDVAHQSHKDWERTMLFSSKAEALLLSESSGSGAKLENEECSALFRSVFERVLRDGNYNGALAYVKERRGKEVDDDNRPWVVLVTGVNGIRKTTTIYQDWYSTLLSEALVAPKGDKQISKISELPIGSNSFFRQLDHMIAVLANQQFALLYSIEQGTTSEESRKAVDAYAKFKDAVFARYRTLSEMIGIIFCRECKRSRMNIMIETSGRDVSMFNYVNELFGEDCAYRKLALRFTINDIYHAEESVDRRMLEEMRRGMEILHDQKEEREDVIIRQVIDVNAGGPYGSAVLKGVQADSAKVWDEVWETDSPVTDGWYKANFKIDGSEKGAWTATAIRPDGTLGSTFDFPLRK